MSEKLKPCPFCGGEAEKYKDRYNKFFCGCPSCKFYYGIELEDGCELTDGWRAVYRIEEEAIEAWNRRAEHE